MIPVYILTVNSTINLTTTGLDSNKDRVVAIDADYTLL